VPLAPGTTGQRAFCGDESGVVRYSPEGKAPTVVDGTCPEGWQPLS
jgi:hypothetical protein